MTSRPSGPSAPYSPQAVSHAGSTSGSRRRGARRSARRGRCTIYGTRPLAEGDTDVPFVPDVDWEDPAATWRALQARIDEGGPVRYTRDPDDDVAYAIHVGWPDDSFRVDVRPRSGSEVRLLGHDSPLDWERDGDEAVVEASDEHERACRYAHAFEIPFETA